MGVSLRQLAIRGRLSGTSFDRCVPSRTVKSSTATYGLDYPWRQQSVNESEKIERYSGKANDIVKKANDVKDMTVKRAALKKSQCL